MKRVARFVALVLIAVWMLGPFAWQLLTSLKPARELTVLPPLWPSELTPSHYIAVFSQHPFLRIIANSALVAACATVLAVTFGALAAYALVKLNVRRAGVVLALVLAVSLFPPIANVSPLFILINGLGLRDTLAALVIVYTGFALPLAIWLLADFFQRVPDEIHVAARIDGCGPLQAFYRVILPLSGPGLAATALLVFIFCWNEFLYALSFTATVAARTIPVEIALFPGLHEIPWGEIAAASIIVTAPLIALAALFHRRIVEGLAAGAVKG